MRGRRYGADGVFGVGLGAWLGGKEKWRGWLDLRGLTDRLNRFGGNNMTLESPIHLRNDKTHPHKPAVFGAEDFFINAAEWARCAVFIVEIEFIEGFHTLATSL